MNQEDYSSKAADLVTVLSQESTPVAMTTKEVEREENQRKILNCVVSGTTLACSAGVFFERAICSRKRHVETSRREEEIGRHTYRKGYYFYSSQYSTVINQRWRLQQYYEHEQGFAHPKYACTAG